MDRESFFDKLIKNANGGNAPDAAMSAMFDACIITAMGFAAKRVYKYFTLKYNGVQPCLEGGIALEGRNIRQHLEGCDGCFLLAVTLGQNAERAIRLEEYRSLARSVVLDICCNIAVEEAQNAVERTLAAELAESGRFITSGFSPGYGDFPLNIQPTVIRLLNAERQIGLTVNASNLLIPRKSITAVIGVADHPVKGKFATCENCLIRSKCEYRRRGTTCAQQ